MTAVILPAELWTIVIRQAVCDWPETSFVPQADNFECIKGLVFSCKRLLAIVTAVRHENLVLDDYEDFVFLWSVPFHSVRCVPPNSIVRSVR